MSIKAPVSMPKTDREFMAWLRAAFDERLQFGEGVPAIVADVGTLYMRTDGGANTTLYVKESGNGLSTGWVAK